MNTLSKTLLAIISGLIIAITGILLYVYWPAITGTINDSQYLTPEQGQELYDKGYADGNRNEEEQLAQIAYYRELTDEYYIQVGLLNNEISVLNGQIVDKNSTITELTNIKNTNLQTIAELNNAISASETIISNLNTQVSGLQTDKTNLQTQVTSLNSDITNKQVIIDGLNTEINELQADITAKRNQIVSINLQIGSLQNQIVELQNSNSSNATQIASLNSQIQTLTNQKADLEIVVADKSSQVSALNSQISTLSNEIVDLQAQIEAKENTISTLNSSIVDLQALNTQLSQTNQSNVNTIATLNNQIVSLNNQISSLTMQIQNNSTSVANLNNRIAELENSIAYYESFIAGLQSDAQVVATFVFDGSVYSIQVINKNAYASVVDPTSTTYKIFNGWKVNGQFVNLANYNVTENTTFVADVTYKYDVVYKVDDQVVNSQIVVKDNYATLPSNPTKANYEFDGWTLDGQVVVNPRTTAITENTTYIAKFTRLYNVTFTYEGTTKATQTVRNGAYASNVYVEDTTYKVFNGWKVDGVIVNVAEYTITANTEFVADITYKYDVVYKVDNSTYNTQIVTRNGYATLPTSPTKNGYEFDGWTVDGTTIINPTTISITENTTFIAKFTKLHTVTFTYENEVKSTQIIRNNEFASNVNVSNTTYKVFNGWKLNGNIVNVSNVAITADTEFVADITYKYDVVFKVENSTYNTQVIERNNCAVAPTNPTKTGYTFNGWTLNGTDVVNVANTQITANTIFTAKFTINSYNVTFVYENEVVNTQRVNYNSVASNVNVENTTYKVFNGWKLNGVIVNVANVVITADTEFVADITYKYDVLFKVDNTTYRSQVVIANGYATIPANPTKSGYEFDGWTLNGNTIVNVSNIQITGNTTFIAKFTRVYTVTFIYDNSTASTQYVRSGNHATNVTVVDTPYKIFNGWKLNGNIVNVETVSITANTQFIADLTYKYDVQFIINNTVCDTQIVDAHGYATLPTVATSENYTFNGWTLDGVNIVDPTTYEITSNTIFRAKLTYVSFANASWAFVSEVSDDIKTNHLTTEQIASKYGWHVGDEKTFAYTGSDLTETMYVQIMGFSHDDLSDGSGKAGISMALKNPPMGKYKMNSSGNNAGGWASASLRYTLNNRLFEDCLPSDLQAVIKAVDKKSTGGQTTDVVTSSDKIWLFSQVEINGTTSAGYCDEGTQYEYWKTVKDGTVNSNLVKKARMSKMSSSTSSVSWWLRSASTTMDGPFLSVNTSGSISYGTTASNTFNCVFGFCI